MKCAALLENPTFDKGNQKPAMFVALFSSFLFKIFPCCPIKLLWGLAFMLMVFFRAPAAVVWQCFSTAWDKKSPPIQACGKDIHNVNPQRIYCAPKGAATWQQQSAKSSELLASNNRATAIKENQGRKLLGSWEKWLMALFLGQSLYPTSLMQWWLDW